MVFLAEECGAKNGLFCEGISRDALPVIAPEQRFGFIVALVIAFVVLGAGIAGIVLLGRRRGAEGRSAGVILGMVVCSLLALGGGITALVIGLVLLGNNR